MIKSLHTEKGRAGLSRRELRSSLRRDTQKAGPPDPRKTVGWAVGSRNPVFPGGARCPICKTALPVEDHPYALVELCPKCGGPLETEATEGKVPKKILNRVRKLERERTGIRDRIQSLMEPKARWKTPNWDSMIERLKGKDGKIKEQIDRLSRYFSCTKCGEKFCNGDVVKVCWRVICPDDPRWQGK